MIENTPGLYVMLTVTDNGMGMNEGVNHESLIYYFYG